MQSVIIFIFIQPSEADLDSELQKLISAADNETDIAEEDSDDSLVEELAGLSDPAKLAGLADSLTGSLADNLTDSEAKLETTPSLDTTPTVIPVDDEEVIVKEKEVNPSESQWSTEKGLSNLQSLLAGKLLFYLRKYFFIYSETTPIRKYDD